VPKSRRNHGSPSSENYEGSASGGGEDDFSRYLKEAAAREILITRHGKPAGILIGFESEDDWLEYRLENDPRF